MVFSTNGHYLLQGKLVRLLTLVKLYQLTLFQLENKLLIDSASKNAGEVKESHRQTWKRKQLDVMTTSLLLSPCVFNKFIAELRFCFFSASKLPFCQTGFLSLL